MNVEDITLVELPGGHTTVVAQESRAVSAPPSAGPMSNALALLQAGVTIEQMRDMLALQREFEAGEARKAFHEAMANFKAEPLTIFKNKQVGYKTKEGEFVGYAHAELSDVVEVVVPAMARHGLSSRWDVQQESQRIKVTCHVTHRLGHSESISMDGAPDSSGKKNVIQQVASTVTYLQRYTLLAITGLSAKSVNPDDDGAGGADDKRDPADGIDAELLQRARDASMQGWVAFSKFVKGCTEMDRKALEPMSASLKDAAKAADAAGGAK